MGKVLQRAGGGKVTVENLAAGNVKSGVTVTVKQGSKTIQQVIGSLIPVTGHELIAMCVHPGTMIGGGLIYADGVNYTSSFTRNMLVDAYIVVACDAYYSVYGYVGSYGFGVSNPGYSYRNASGFVPVNVTAGQTIYTSVNTQSWSWPGNSGVFVFVFQHH